jgi:hypothetical protein
MAKRKGDLVALIVIFVAVLVFIPIAIKYLNSLFGNVISGFQNMIVPKVDSQATFGSPYLPCRSPDPATGAVCDEGQFCDGATNTCVKITVLTTGEQRAYGA